MVPTTATTGFLAAKTTQFVEQPFRPAVVPPGLSKW